MKMTPVCATDSGHRITKRRTNIMWKINSYLSKVQWIDAGALGNTWPCRVEDRSEAGQQPVHDLVAVSRGALSGGRSGATQKEQRSRQHRPVASRAARPCHHRAPPA